MSGEITWKVIIESLTNNPTDFKTIPTTNREPLWFNAFIGNKELYVRSSQNKKPSCKITGNRKISKDDYLTVYSYYHRWADGETHLRQIVRTLSRNTAYIFAIINKYE
jgi:hypothetical protein